MDLPKELKLHILSYLDYPDARSYIQAFNVEISITDFILLLNLRNPELTDKLLAMQYPKNFDIRYLLYLNINIIQPLDKRWFIEQYHNGRYIYNQYPKLYEVVYSEVKSDSNLWTSFCFEFKDGFFVGNLAFFTVDIYHVLKVLDEYQLLKDAPGDWYREIPTEIVQLNIGAINGIKYLKYTYNKFGDKGYFSLFLKDENMLRWFLGLPANINQITDDFVNTRGPITINDSDYFEYIEDSLSTEELDNLKVILNEFIDKYVGISGDEIVESVENAKGWCYVLETRDEDGGEDNI